MSWYKIAQDSSQFEWHYDADEIFDFMMSRFNVSKAKEIIHNKPREVHNMSLEGIKDIIPKRPIPTESGESYTMLMNVSVDWKEVDKKTMDLNFPVIVITNQNGSYLPIDGWHRMAKALDQNIMSITAVLLDKEESEQVSM